MSEASKGNLIRELGLSQALSIGLGTMIGAGIFVLSAIAAEKAGPGATFSYLIAGLICLPTAMTVSELATGMPRAGGSYHLISRALGPLAGAVVGPGNWLGLIFATGFYLIGFAQYVAYLLPVPTWMTALATGILFTYLNYRGIKLSGQVQNVIVVLLVLILALFVGRGLFNVDPALHRPFVPHGWGAVMANVGLIIVSFTGFEKISTVAEEIKWPERNLPLSIVGSVIMATVLYVAILYVTTGVLPYQIMADFQAPLVEAARRFMSFVGVAGISLAALLATASSANAAIMASSRINFAMGRDNILPGWFNEIHPKYLTPHRSVLATGGLATLLALSGQAKALAEVSSALFMVNYALLSLSLVVMRQARPAWYRPAYRIPLYPWLPLMGGALALAVIGTMERAAQMAGLGLVSLSLAWYALWGQRRTAVKGELRPWLEREQPLEAAISRLERAAEARRHEILVPVANPATVRGLIALAAALARGHERAKVVALRVVPVPPSTPLSAAQAYLAHQEGHWDILRLATECGAEAGVEVETLLRAAHGIASGIIGMAEGRPEIRLILLGWHGPLTLSRIRTSADKQVVQRAPCDVAVFLNKGLTMARRILVLAGGGPHARLGLRLAYGLMADEDAELVVLRVVRAVGEVNSAAEEEALRKLIRRELGESNGRVKSRIVRSPSAVGAILAEARKGYDLAVVGASEEWFLHNWLLGAIPDVVAERAPCSVLLVRKHEPRSVSWLRRALRRIRS